MNTECMYVLKSKNIDDAKEFVVYLENYAIKTRLEVLPTYVSIVTDEFKVTSDYDGFNQPFKVRPGEIVVWAYGKDYDMYRIKPRGVRRAFPYALNPDHSFTNKIKDVYVVRRDKETNYKDLVKIEKEVEDEGCQY